MHLFQIRVSPSSTVEIDATKGSGSFTLINISKQKLLVCFFESTELFFVTPSTKLLYADQQIDVEVALEDKKMRYVLIVGHVYCELLNCIFACSSILDQYYSSGVKVTHKLYVQTRALTDAEFDRLIRDVTYAELYDEVNSPV